MAAVCLSQNQTKSTTGPFLLTFCALLASKNTAVSIFRPFENGCRIYDVIRPTTRSCVFKTMT